MDPEWVLVLILSIPTFATLFWWIGTEFFTSTLNLLEYLEFAGLVAAIVTGGYQLYFWVQRHNHQYPTRCFKIDLDDRIPFWPRWIWIYNLLYYVMIGLTAVSIGSLEEGVHLIFGGLMLLLSGTAIFYFFQKNQSVQEKLGTLIMKHLAWNVKLGAHFMILLRIGF